MAALVVFKAAPGSYYSDPERSATFAEMSAMLAPLDTPHDSIPTAPRERRTASSLALALALRFPFLCFYLVVLGSNVVGSIFNSGYNLQLIIRFLDEVQQAVFWNVALPWYNIIAYPLGIALTIYLLWPLYWCRKRLLAGDEVPPVELELCRRRLVNLPFFQVCINFLCWVPGAVIFPLLICTLGDWTHAGSIWGQFALSFLVSALLTTAQTFFLLEWYLGHVFYPDFFQGARPAAVEGAFQISFRIRLTLLGSAVAVPLLALLLVALNFGHGDNDQLKTLAVLVTVCGAGSGGLIFWLVGRDLSRWMAAHTTATEQVELGNFDIHVLEQRSDEWGRLTDRFNDMVGALARGRQLRETFGQFVSPEIRDDILQNFPGLGGEVQTITVLFADIRGFTRRTAGENPERVVDLLNRFLSLAVNAVENNGGYVNKFLGDGVMALFGVRQRRPDHADQALTAARVLLSRLQALNAELKREGQAPLDIGIGIHTGQALVGCIGATLTPIDGRERMRREFTAIGETVNLAQRMEQLTKTLDGPILLSEETHKHLRQTLQLQSLGIVTVPGYGGSLVVYRVAQA